MRCGFSVRWHRFLLGAFISTHLNFGTGYAYAVEPAYLTGLVFLGSGCSEGDGTVAQLADLDGNGLPEQFTILFSKAYIAKRGPGIGSVQQRLYCNLVIGVHLPDGYQFGVSSALQTGYADLPKGTSGTQRTDYEFTFYSDIVSRETSLSGNTVDLRSIWFGAPFWAEVGPGTSDPVMEGTRVQVVAIAVDGS